MTPLIAIAAGVILALLMWSIANELKARCFERQIKTGDTTTTLADAVGMALGLGGWIVLAHAGVIAWWVSP